MYGVYEQRMSAQKFKGRAFQTVKCFGKLMLLYGDVEGISEEKHKYVGDKGEIVGTVKFSAFYADGIQVAVNGGEGDGHIGDEKMYGSVSVKVHKYYPEQGGGYEKRLPRYLIKQGTEQSAYCHTGAEAAQYPEHDKLRGDKI